jgi:diacylglycerol kinase family enzyme
VGGRLFLNNVSLGTYARLVHRRERHRRRGEALARLRALTSVARHRHTLHARIDGEPVRARVVLVGNNAYEVALFTVGERERLDRGELQVWTAAGWLPTAWEGRVGPRFRIDLPEPRVRVAIDGEPALLEPPLELEVLPRALRLRLPPAAEGGHAMHDQPEPTEEEHEQAPTERGNEEESMRYPSHGQPDAPDSAEDAEE